MRPIHLVFALAIVAALPAAAHAKDLDATARPDAVTVYRSMARVSRIAHVKLGKGEVTVHVADLPPGLVDDSLRVTGKGIAKARIYGATVDSVTAPASTDPDVLAAQKKLESLQAQDTALADKINSANARLSFIDAFRSSYPHASGSQLLLRKVDAKEIASLADLVVRQHDEAAATIRDTGAKRRALADRIQAARIALSKLQAKARRTTKTVTIELSVDRPGRFALTLSYLVYGASWRPVWDARLDPKTDKVTLSLYAAVSQSTGMDWNDVTLGVSTSQPQNGLAVPDLSPRYITKGYPRRSYSHRGYAPAMARRAEAPPPMAAAEARGGGVASKKIQFNDEELKAPVAQVTQGLLSATFTAPRRETVTGAGKTRRAFLADYGLQAKLTRVTAPRNGPQVFLVAKAKNTTGVPLLPGRASVFLGPEMVGSSSIPMVAQNDEVKLAFGADDRVKVERKVLERKHDTSGLFSKDEVMRYHVRTTVKNLWRHPVTVTLLDQVPVSRDDTIKVKILDGSTKPTGKPDSMKPGVRTHVLKIGAGKKTAVDLKYEVHWPEGKPVSGLD